MVPYLENYIKNNRRSFMFSLKKIASVVMATAMAVTTAVPGTAIVANAETTTIKTRVKNSDKKQNTINATSDQE